MEYSYNENIEIKSIFPGKDFDNLYNKLLEKKYLNEPLKYITNDCSYGITIISDSPEIYCKYHGNRINTNNYESLGSSIRYYRSDYSSFGFFVLICCIILAICISIVKGNIKKLIKRRSK
jgi:hypothetical protein